MINLEFTIRGDPRTKKNSQRIIIAGRRRIIKPSAQYEAYAEAAAWQLPRLKEPISEPVNIRCVYYMATRRKVDLVNLMESTLDILVAGKVIADDNSNIAVSHDGSRVEYDKSNPRAEITITPATGRMSP